MRNVVQQSFVVFTIGEKSYTVVYQKYMKENVVSSEISIQNKAEMSFQMKRHRTYFRTRVNNIETERYETCLNRYKCYILFKYFFYFCIGFVYNYHFVSYFETISFAMVNQYPDHVRTAASNVAKSLPPIL